MQISPDDLWKFALGVPLTGNVLEKNGFTLLKNRCCLKLTTVILNNAPWHKKAVRLVQAEALPEYQDIRDKMSFIFLPPYSPDLNPIEQVWRITRREVTHNTYFANPQTLEDTLDDYFAFYRQPNDKLASLCAFKCES